MRLKRKIPTFIFGVSIGLVIGVGIFIFKITDIFNNLKDAAKEQITVIQQPVKNVKDEGEEVKKKDKERFKIHLGSTTKVNYHEVDSLIKQDSELNVATDELLSVKNIKIINIGDPSPQDTSASKNAGVETNYSNLYFVEFWRTPLNSKGYRFSKNKIMLYGFMDYTNVSLYQLENEFYIKCTDQVYKIQFGSDFKQLERVVDSDLLAKIN
ncbi:MAG: hypothetical protein H0W61_06050 [Bacteroidetes bacterium]|nr:hypothetical protein [Bacteroidota bacterium]